MARKTRTSTSRRRKAAKTDPILPLAAEIEFLRQEMTQLAQGTYDKLTRLQDATGGVWKMRDGTMIAVRDMSDSHLSNVLKLVKMNPPSAGSQGWISLFEAEIERRRVDREWAAKTGHVSEVEKRLAALEAKVTGDGHGAEDQLRMLRARVAHLEEKLRKPTPPAFDLRLQITTALTQIRRHLPIEQIDVVRSLERLLDAVLP